MASTTALYTGLSGLTANARKLEVIGNNIANANTTAFKSSRMMFQTQFSRILSEGSAPDTFTGGTDPTQIGLGVGIAGTQRDFTGGSITATGDPRDLAIDGKGFFILDRSGQQLFTRAGNFTQDSQNNLVTINGDHVQGFTVDSNFQIIPGQLVDLNIPVGSMKLAQATQNVRFAGNLNAGGDIATLGSLIRLGTSATQGFTLLPSAPPPNPGDVIESTNRLTDISDPNAPASPLFSSGEFIQVTGAQKGGGTIPTDNFQVGATSTVQDLMTFLDNALGLNLNTGANPDGSAPGATLDPTTGMLKIVGNTGTANDLAIDSTDIRLLDSSGQFLRSPITPTKDASATGESTRTTFVVYDSLGTPLAMNVSMVMESKGDAGSTWRYYVDSPQNTDPNANVATGVLHFDTQGQLENPAPIAVQVDRAGTGALSPLSMNLNFSGGADTVSALASDSSTLASVFQDGASLGVLSSFGVGPDGIITGAFSNGMTRTLGQVALSTFANQEGLVESSDNTFSVGINSGPPVITAPTGFGTGQIVGGSLEASNVDLGQQFIDMIVTSTGYSASSRVIKTADDLLQQLLVLGR